MSSKTEAVNVLEQIQKESVSTKEERFAKKMKLGEVAQQGDLYLTVVDTVPEGAITGDRQLAPGTSQGSRHFVEGNVEIYPYTGNDPLTGPLVVAKERIAITHPEHANLSLPALTYRVTYQRDFAAEEIQRVMD